MDVATSLHLKDRDARSRCGFSIGTISLSKKSASGSGGGGRGLLIIGWSVYHARSDTRWQR